MAHGFQALGGAQIDVTKDSQTQSGFAEAGLLEVRPAEVRLAEVRPPRFAHADAPR